jgi:hypothetical protein
MAVAYALSPSAAVAPDACKLYRNDRGVLDLDVAVGEVFGFLGLKGAFHHVASDALGASSPSSTSESCSPSLPLRPPRRSSPSNGATLQHRDLRPLKEGAGQALVGGF